MPLPVHLIYVTLVRMRSSTAFSVYFYLQANEKINKLLYLTRVHLRSVCTKYVYKPLSCIQRT
jgi:hypothetical protein